MNTVVGSLKKSEEIPKPNIWFNNIEGSGLKMENKME